MTATGDQLPLWGPAPGMVGRNHPDTSRLAADAVMPATGTQRRRVYDLIRSTGEDGCTDDYVQWRLNMAGNTERPRRLELVAAGLVWDSGERRRIDGRLMIVWRAV